ncbi:type II toxin-antitoxin system HicB family antitoxin [Vibrio harveyi]|uniref:type II toxin-antitoxin system HicB family antitoxin n=1 Tax=Vibrio harveyi TaxID=669 RepID=UPI003CF194FE
MNITGVFFVQPPLQIEIDVSRYSGKTQRVNVSLPESLLAVIDRRVENSDLYRDRSHFLFTLSDTVTKFYISRSSTNSRKRSRSK